MAIKYAGPDFSCPLCAVMEKEQEMILGTAITKEGEFLIKLACERHQEEELLLFGEIPIHPSLTRWKGEFYIFFFYFNLFFLLLNLNAAVNSHKPLDIFLAVFHAILIGLFWKTGRYPHYEPQTEEGEE